MMRKGIVLAGGAGSRLHPLTLAVSKQMLPVYDKPMIYYPISVLMLADIRDILVISTPHDLPLFRQLLGDGSQFGLQFEYAEQPSPNGLSEAFIIGESFLSGSPSCLILGDNLFFGQDLPSKLRGASGKIDRSSIFAYPVADPERYGVVEIDGEGRLISLEEKPVEPKSNLAVPGLYFFDATAPERAREQQPSKRGELEITDLIQSYLKDSLLDVTQFGRGTAWLDTGTHDSLLQASQFVETIQQRQGLMIACLEEIAFKRGWIDESHLRKRIEQMGKSTYAQYLRRFADNGQK
jgi:glucose-1-phosphate thymidylyltransferase